jgi:glycosyltransferase involved in cell wall biosynthesis
MVDAGPTDGGSNKATISVVAVVKDGARFIADALSSVGLSQIQPIEILVVDGGSTDGTLEIVRRVPKVRVIHQASRGIANAYNEAIKEARGEILAFISADDVWLPGKLDRHMEAFSRDPELLASVSLVEHFLEEGCAIPNGFRTTLLERPRPGLLMEALVVKRQLFDSVGGFDPSFSTGEDTDWFARARDEGIKFAVIPEVLVRKRVHDANASLNDPENKTNILRAVRASIARKRRASHSQDV